MSATNTTAFDVDTAPSDRHVSPGKKLVTLSGQLAADWRAIVQAIRTGNCTTHVTVLFTDTFERVEVRDGMLVGFSDDYPTGVRFGTTFAPEPTVRRVIVITHQPDAVTPDWVLDGWCWLDGKTWQRSGDAETGRWFDEHGDEYTVEYLTKLGVQRHPAAVAAVERAGR